MAADIRPLIAGNWKMNGVRPRLLRSRSWAACWPRQPVRADVAICPPATLVARLSAVAPAGVLTGGQDCHTAASGAFTGDVSAAMLADAGAQFVIVGHSERRADHGETDALVRAKAQAALARRPHPDHLRRRNPGRAGRRARSMPWSTGSSPDRSRTRQPAATLWSPTSRCGRSAPDSRRRPTRSPPMHGMIREQLVARFGAAGRDHPHSLWRLAETGQRPRNSRHRQRQWRARRRRQPLGGRLLRHYLSGVSSCGRAEHWPPAALCICQAFACRRRRNSTFPRVTAPNGERPHCCLSADRPRADRCHPAAALGGRRARHGLELQRPDDASAVRRTS